LGKTSGRSYKAAPRQLLQVDASNASTSPTLAHANAHISKEDSPSPQIGTAAAEEAAKLGREALGAAAAAASTDGLVRTDPLTHRQSLVMLEGLYDMVLEVEQLRRDQPPPEEEAVFQQWQSDYDNCVEEIFLGLKVMAPLEISNPHPFVCLLQPTKGKKLIPRLSRHLRSNHMLTILTLLVACFSQLDVIKDGPILDTWDESPERVEAEKQTHCFLGTVMQSILPLVAKSNLRLISGLLGLLLDRTDIIAVAFTRPGIALLTVFLSRVELIKQNMSNIPAEDPDYPTPEEAQQWQLMFDHLFQLLTPSFLNLFPSTRMAPSMPPELVNDPSLDRLDYAVWSFLAALALHAVPQQHEILVTALREKVLHNVLSANKGWVHDEEARQTKLANVNLFLHALGLDSSFITM
jgi:DNA topoisomerase 2-associated protein PAT1